MRRTTAQVSVMAGFAGVPDAAGHHAPALLDEAVMIPLTLPAGLPCIGRTIAELRIRKACGASIIAIERAGKRIVNPLPDERLLADDIVMLFGIEEQVRQARSELLG